MSHIVLYRPADILKSGMVLVDLPGVGSLTAENTETTMRYINNLCTAIFAIPTNPTIRRDDETLIRAVWTKFPKALFVQNAWEGEPPIVIRDSSDFNKITLRKIAGSINSTFDPETDFAVVNVYGAAHGRINGDVGRTEKSGILHLMERLEFLVQNWTDSLQKGLEGRMKNLFNSTKETILLRKDEIGKTAEEIHAKRSKIIAEFEEQTSKITDETDDVLDFIAGKRNEFTKISDEESKNCADNIRKRIYEVIDGGVTDGEKLNEAFLQIQQREVGLFSDQCVIAFNQLKNEVTDMLEDIKGIAETEGFSFADMEFNKNHQLKWEKGTKILIDVGSTAGLSILGGLLGGIPGAIVGATASLAIYYITNSGKKKINKIRGNETKAEIDGIIDELQRSLRDKTYESYRNMKKQIEECIDNYIEMRNQFIEEQKEEMLKNVRPPEDNGQLDADLEYLNEKEKMYGV